MIQWHVTGAPHHMLCRSTLIGIKRVMPNAFLQTQIVFISLNHDWEKYHTGRLLALAESR